MSSFSNVGSALLIVGSIWLHLHYGLHLFWTILLCLFGIGMWVCPSHDEEAKDLQKRLLRAKIEYYQTKTKEASEE